MVFPKLSELELFWFRRFSTYWLSVILGLSRGIPISWFDGFNAFGCDRSRAACGGVALFVN
jgi:hypothetical protein